MSTEQAAARVRLWPALQFRDVDAMTAWLRTIGFVEHGTYRDESGTVVHAEWLWPAGGGIMFGAVRPDAPLQPAGSGAAYLVTDDPDAVFDAALAAGATVERAMADQDYGGRGGSVRDPEGNHWSFGSYQPGGEPEE
ncbi:VOC family protein [Nocardioides nitrophenolicus]|uniref:VOC family protein n=1 Tax=Nocardioides nitrophenolicus TaxID=60489 RepID=UPI00195829CB|nr:VOC family protein [Nocardioides nitrophenolicus]MBM7515083.1 putative glyoxalase superfamily protein PhnB [Nocardioides nitrophenolicus]